MDADLCWLILIDADADDICQSAPTSLGRISFVNTLIPIFSENPIYSFSIKLKWGKFGEQNFIL